MLRDGWPYFTIAVRGVPVPFQALPLPSERAELVRWYEQAGDEARALVDAAKAPEATEADVRGADRALLLVEGRVGYVLMRLWAGGESATLAKWHADAVAGEGQLVHFPGDDHKLLAGREFLREFHAATGLAYELAAKLAQVAITYRPPQREPSGPEVDEITSFFGHGLGAGIGL